MRQVVLVARKRAGEREFQFKGYCRTCQKFGWVYRDETYGSFCTTCVRSEER